MRKLERLITKYILKIVYLLSSILPIKNRIVFATYRTLEIQGNFKFIYDELQSRNLDYDYVFLFEKYNPSIKGKIKYMLHMMKANYYLATSKYFIIDDYYFPVYIVNLRKGTEVIQVWHACGAFKKFGYSVLDKTYGADNDYVKLIPIHTNYTHVIVSGKEVVKHYAHAFNMDEANIKPIGVPRTDMLLDKKQSKVIANKVYDEYPILKEKKVILYAPTFRGDTQASAKFDIDLNINKLLNNISDDYILVLKMHPFVSNNISIAHDRVLNLSKYEDINELLLVTDILITDYSSVIFEYSLLDRPTILYTTDKEEYIKQRDFYYEYESFVPGPITTNTDELINVINSENWDLKKIKEFKNKFFDILDGKASKRLVDEIILKKDTK